MNRLQKARQPAQRVVARAVFAALSAMTMTAAASAKDGAPAAVDTVRQYRIEPGPLAAALEQFKALSGIVIEAPAALTEGRRSPGLSGEYGAEMALSRLLQGTGLSAGRAADGRWTLHAGAAPRQAGSLPAITVVGTSLETDARIYPGSVAVIGREALEQHGTVISAMSELPGVTTGGDSGRMTGEQFNIRGFGYQSEDRVIVLQDGVRRSVSLYSNHISSFRSDNDLLKQVEVVKGASSVQNGGGAIGGVVAMTTKDAKDFVPTGQHAGFAVKTRYESNDYREGYVAAAYAPDDKPYELLAYAKKGRAGDMKMSRQFSVDANGKGIDTVDNDEDLRVLYLQGAIRPAAGHRLSLSHYDYKLDNETTWQTLYHTNYSTTTGPVIGELQQRDTVAKYRYIDPTRAWLNVTGTVYHSRSSYDRGYTYVDIRNGTTNALDYENADKRYGLRLSNEAHFETGSVLHRLVAGVDYEKRKEDATYLLNGVYSDFGSLPNTYKDSGAYGHLESTFWDGRLVTQLSGRYDRFDRRVDANEGSYDGDHFSPRLGASLRVVPGLQFLANWSEAFRAPTPHETSSEGPLNPHYWYLPNPDLKPETIREYELGFSYEKKGVFAAADSFETKLMYFDGRIQDMIALALVRPDETSPEGSPYGMYRNVDRVKRHGVEWQASYEHALGGISLAYSTLSQKNEANDQDTPQAFADKLNIGAFFNATPGLRLGGSVTHWFKPSPNPASLVSGGKTYWYVRDDYTVANVYARWRPNAQGSGFFGRDLSVRVGVNNVFDASYLNARDVETTTRVGKGRNVFATLETRF